MSAMVVSFAAGACRMLLMYLCSRSMLDAVIHTIDHCEQLRQMQRDTGHHSGLSDFRKALSCSSMYGMNVGG